MNINAECAKIVADRKKFFDRAFAGMNIPEDFRRLSERLCVSYGINGFCDPGYIANVIAFELGLGDGKGHFTKQEDSK